MHPLDERAYEIFRMYRDRQSLYSILKSRYSKCPFIIIHYYYKMSSMHFMAQVTRVLAAVKALWSTGFIHLVMTSD